MKNKLKNKKAMASSEMVLWVYRFVLITLVFVAYLLIVFSFFATSYDIRSSENILLGKNMIDCISQQGIIPLDDFTEGWIKKCLGFGDGGENEHYLSATLNYSLKNSSYENSTEVSIGNKDVSMLCGGRGKNTPSCLSQKYYVLVDDSGIKRGKLELLIITNKIEEKHMNV